MMHVRLLLDIRRSFTLVGLVAILAGMSEGQIQFSGPQPGDVYSEYSRVMRPSDGEQWRVTDPLVNTSVYPAAIPFLPNPQVSLYIGDLSGAIRAEAVFSMWGGHISTNGRKLRFNGHGWIDIPDLDGSNGIPGGHFGFNYIHQSMVTVPVPLDHLFEGTNYFEGTNAGQVSGPDGYGFGWGQHGWYNMMIRVYYGNSKTHPTGSITSPSASGTMGDNPTIAVNITQGTADRVDVLAYYDGYDTDGDGVYQEYHYDYHSANSESDMTIHNHVGTAYGPFSFTWDNVWVPDQSGMKMMARIRGTNGVWYVTPEVTNLSLLRSNSSVKLYKPLNTPERAWARGDLDVVRINVNIPSGDDINKATSAVYHNRTWNGLDNVREPGETHYRRFNGSDDGEYGLSHNFSYDLRPVPGTIQSGNNQFSFYSQTVLHHGMEIIWPGPALTVRYSEPLPIQLAAFSAVVVSAREILIKWSTLSETNNYGFEVQRAFNEPSNFATIANSFTAGHGTTLDPRNYTYVDTEGVNGVVYYRLKQIDLDGTVHLFDPIRVDLLTSVVARDVPTVYRLEQAYPNPFNPSTKIQYALPVSGMVRLRLFNQLGQVVRELTNGYQAAGYHEMTLNADGLSSGIYYYRLEAGAFVDSKKVVLLR
jgi:hypothetical protein